MMEIKQKYQDLFFQTEQTVNRKKTGFRAARNRRCLNMIGNSSFPAHNLNFHWRWRNWIRAARNPDFFLFTVCSVWKNKTWYFCLIPIFVLHYGWFGDLLPKSTLHSKNILKSKTQGDLLLKILWPLYKGHFLRNREFHHFLRTSSPMRLITHLLSELLTHHSAPICSQSRLFVVKAVSKFEFQLMIMVLLWHFFMN